MKPLKQEVIGATDYVDFPDLGWTRVPVRIDSGAATSSIHCSRVKLVKEGDTAVLHFSLDTKKGAPAQSFSVTEFREKLIKNSSGKSEKRFVIKTCVRLFGRKIRTEFSLANRTKMSFPVLLGRKLLNGRFIVDVSQKDLSYKRLIRSAEAVAETHTNTHNLPHSLKLTE